MQELITIPEIMERYSVKRGWVSNWIAKGYIRPAKVVKNRHLYSVKDLNEFFQNRPRRSN